MAPIVAELTSGAASDEVDDLVLDATLDLLTTVGLRRWSIDDVADRAGVGRTTVYRRFDGRDRLGHAAPPPGLRRVFPPLPRRVAPLPPRVGVGGGGVLVGLEPAPGSVLLQHTERDPAAFTPLLTTGAGPLVAAARDLLVGLAVAEDPDVDPAAATLVAEALVRLAMSFVVTPESAFSLDDPERARAALRSRVAPLLTSPRR